ncbi:hypothetical protein AB0B94_31265 [Micromonospora sp. NPDC048986]|uniref:hypothetical protein n=1 Tax=Micromonospora sp. NPDC048986 TaxID=3155644 RepID=UPI0033C1D8D2
MTDTKTATPTDVGLRDLIAAKFAEFMHEEGAAHRSIDFADDLLSALAPMPAAGEHLRGPWRAIVADDHGFILDSLDDLNGDDEVKISIRRGSALPTAGDDSDDDDERLPGSCSSGDLIELWDHLYVEDGDPSTDAPARWVQAQAMADGLNAAGNRLPEPTGFIWTVTP